MRYQTTAIVVAVSAILVCGAFASETAMTIGKQEGSPARLITTTHGMQDWLKAAQLKNESNKRIVSYKIGWAYVLPQGTEVKYGPWMNVPAGIEPGSLQDVPAQSVLPKFEAKQVIFFVAELRFADGTRWKADTRSVIRSTSR